MTRHRDKDVPEPASRPARGPLNLFLLPQLRQISRRQVRVGADVRASEEIFKAEARELLIIEGYITSTAHDGGSDYLGILDPIYSAQN